MTMSVDMRPCLVQPEGHRGDSGCPECAGCGWSGSRWVLGSDRTRIRVPPPRPRWNTRPEGFRAFAVESVELVLDHLQESNPLHGSRPTCPHHLSGGLV